MSRLDKEHFIRTKAVENQDSPFGEKILWSRHAIVELLKDGLTRLQVEQALISGEIIEDYPAEHRPLPDCLILSKLGPKVPIHVVVAIDENNDRIFIVTVYLPAKDRRQDDWRTRK